MKPKFYTDYCKKCDSKNPHLLLINSEKLQCIFCATQHSFTKQDRSTICISKVKWYELWRIKDSIFLTDNDNELKRFNVIK